MKFIKQSLLALTLLSLTAELLPRGGGGHGGHGGHGGGGHHGGRGRGGYGRGGYGRGGYGRGWGGRGLGLGIGLGLGFGYWGLGGWGGWDYGWWNTSPYWYRGNDWVSLSQERRLNAIEDQMSQLKDQQRDSDSRDLREQLGHLKERHDALENEVRNN